MISKSADAEGRSGRSVFPTPKRECLLWRRYAPHPTGPKLALNWRMGLSPLTVSSGIGTRAYSSCS
jgi:hypothetical protein